MISYGLRTNGLKIPSSNIFRCTARYISLKPPKDPKETSPAPKRRLPSLPKAKAAKAATTRVSGNEEVVRSLRKSKKTKQPTSPMKASTITSGERKASTANYIPYNKFPKAPEYIHDLSDEDFDKPVSVASLNPKPPTPNPHTYIDFKIPDKFVKSKISISDKISEKERGIVDALNDFAKAESQEDMEKFKLKFVKYYYDPDTDSFEPLPEHDLKTSILGMMSFNPQLNDIEDEYLWKLFPKHKLFGVPPFETIKEPHGFKVWEQSQLEKQREKKEAKKLVDKEYKDFKLSLTDSKSVYTKLGSRRKIDRRLVKKYKELKEKGALPKTDIEDGEDNDDIF